MQQAIIYDEATGKVLRVLDPMTEFELHPMANMELLRKQVGVQPGEGVVLFEKNHAESVLQHGHVFYHWQAFVDAHLGKSP